MRNVYERKGGEKPGKAEVIRYPWTSGPRERRWGRNVGWMHVRLQCSSRKSSTRPSGTPWAMAACQRTPVPGKEPALVPPLCSFADWGADVGTVVFTLRQWWNLEAMRPSGGVHLLQWEIKSATASNSRFLPPHFPVLLPSASNSPHHHSTTVFH